MICSTVSDGGDTVKAEICSCKKNMQKRTLKKELGISRPTKSRSQIKPDKDEHGSAYMICDLPAEVPQNKAQKICRKNFKKLFEKKRYTF